MLVAFESRSLGFGQDTAGAVTLWLFVVNVFVIVVDFVLLITF